MIGESADGKPKYLYDLIRKYQENSTYELNLVGFEEIEFYIHELTEFEQQMDSEPFPPEL